MSKSREKEKKNIQIYVRGFSKSIRESELKETFQEAGKVKEVNIKNGYAFIVKIII